MMEEAQLKKGNEILQELVNQQVEEIDWQFRENERLRNVLLKLPDEAEIYEINKTVASYLLDRGAEVEDVLKEQAKAITKRIGKE